MFRKTEYIKQPVLVYPPDELLQECEQSKLEGHTIGDGLKLAFRLKKDLEECNENIKSIKDWKDKSQEEPQ